MSEEERTIIARDIALKSMEILEENKQYIGILLCEGTSTSIDVCLYQKIYSLLLVVPVGGCSDVRRLISPIKKRMKPYQVFGIIDRDSASKVEVRKLKKQGIYCTKLPFIENIISCPEVLKILCEVCGKDYHESSKTIRKKLLYVLSKKIRDALPINIPIGENEPIASISIRIKRQNGSIVEKTVSEANIMYAYRDKAVANETSEALRIVGRTKYYNFFKRCIEDEKIKSRILKCVSAYLPVIELESEEENFGKISI